MSDDPNRLVCEELARDHRRTALVILIAASMAAGSDAYRARAKERKGGVVVRLLALTILAALSGCGPTDRPGYVMRYSTAAIEVKCAWRDTREPKWPDGFDPRVDYICIKMCLVAGFRGDDEALEKSTGWELLIPGDKRDQTAWGIPEPCQQ